MGQADAKINHFVEDLGDGEPRVEDVCGPGVDSDFDQLISALGHIARPKPKPLIDTVMYWRKSKGEAATNAKTEFLHVGLEIAALPLPLTRPRLARCILLHAPPQGETMTRLRRHTQIIRIRWTTPGILDHHCN